MAVDLAALRAKLAAQKANAPTPTPVSNPVSNTSQTSGQASVVTSAANGSNSTNAIADNSPPAPTVNAPAVLGTGKTTEIDHLDFIAKMNSLSEAILKQHPTMPVLLMQIHKQLRADPELVTTLDDDAIGIIVKGLQVQTKTELVVAAAKPTKSKKNPAISVDLL